MYSGNGLEDNLKMVRDASSQGEGWLAATVRAPVGLDPLSVAGTRGDLSIYWEQPSEGIAAAGFGVAGVEEASERHQVFEVLARLAANGHIEWLGDSPRPFGPWFGGLAFDLSRAPSNGWTGFPLSRWILPELLVWIRGGQAFLTAFAPRGAGATPERLRQRLAAAAEAVPRGRREPSRPVRELSLQVDPAGWRKLMESALSAISAASLSKVVAARAIDASARSEFEILEVLARLRAYAPSCTTFLFKGAEDAVFVGATPERLCRVASGVVETEALAGSASPGESDAWLEQDKEKREHGAVTDAIVEGLAPLSESVQVAPPVVMALPNVKHLRTPIRAKLREGVGPAEVVRALHPTPAVGGTPRDRALAFLREHEGLERGWYAGAVGWMGAGDAELKVALRSALLHGKRARLYVGAGVVAGSTVEGEWQETEAKSALMLDALGGGA